MLIYLVNRVAYFDIFFKLIITHFILYNKIDIIVFINAEYNTKSHKNKTRYFNISI